MTVRIRAARHQDVEHIRPWTTTTFDWGDYIPDRLPTWIDDPDSFAMVCVDDRDTPIALSHALMLSDDEGWLEGARVHPDHKRSGLGTAMNNAGVEWCRRQKALVVRLAIEEDNVPAKTQVLTLGYRETSRWLYGNYEVRDVMSRPTERFRLKPAGRAEVDAAWMMWSASDLAHAGRGLIAKGWQWRKARPADLRDAVRKKSLYQSPTGWAIVEEARPGVLRTTWVATTPENAPGMIDGLLDLTARRERANLTLMLPSLPWAAEAVRRGGSVPAEELVYSLSL